MSRESQHTHFEDKIQEQLRLLGFPPTCASLVCVLCVSVCVLLYASGLRSVPVFVIVCVCVSVCVSFCVLIRAPGLRSKMAVWGKG